jgi:hypothetical protein
MISVIFEPNIYISLLCYSHYEVRRGRVAKNPTIAFIDAHNQLPLRGACELVLS